MADRYTPNAWSAPRNFFFDNINLPPRGVNPSQIESAKSSFFCPKSPVKVVGPYNFDFPDFKMRILNGCRFWSLQTFFLKFCDQVSLGTYEKLQKKFENFRKIYKIKFSKTCFSQISRFRSCSVVLRKRFAHQMKALGLLIDMNWSKIHSFSILAHSG